MILFGQGGTAAEIIRDRAIGLPPLNLPLTVALMAVEEFESSLDGAPGYGLEVGSVLGAAEMLITASLPAARPTSPTSA